MAGSGDGVTLYTLGHSRHAIDQFIALARRHHIALVVDVRGQPYSRFNPQYNRERFEESLKQAGIAYRWYGEHLSGRPKSPEFRGPDSKVLWDRLRRSPALQHDLDEVVGHAAGTPLALVCAEEDPKRCHRRFLLTPPLIERGVAVLHIRGDGRIETEEELAERERGADDGQLSLFGPDG